MNYVYKHQFKGLTLFQLNHVWVRAHTHTHDYKWLSCPKDWEPLMLMLLGINPTHAIINMLQIMVFLVVTTCNLEMRTDSTSVTKNYIPSIVE